MSDKHQQSKFHKFVLTFDMIVLQCRNTLEMIETLQYLARQGLAVGSNDDNESNFIQLLRLQSKKVPELIDWLSK